MNGQAHVLGFWESLDDKQRKALLAQVEGLDFANLARMKEMLSAGAAGKSFSDIEPAAVVPLSSAKTPDSVKAGEDAIRKGAVGVILVAGGQGSRLGYEGPKGCYAIGPVSNASLFEIHSRKILALEQTGDRFEAIGKEVNVDIGALANVTSECAPNQLRFESFKFPH